MGETSEHGDSPISPFPQARQTPSQSIWLVVWPGDPKEIEVFRNEILWNPKESSGSLDKKSIDLLRNLNRSLKALEVNGFPNYLHCVSAIYN